MNKYDYFEKSLNLALDSSEIWKLYSSAQLRNEEELLKQAMADNESDCEQVDEYMAKINKIAQSNPSLMAELKRVAQYLEQHPEIKESADKDFLNGLSLIDFGEE